MESSPFALIAKLESITVVHAAYAEIVVGLRTAIEMAQHTRSPANCLLVGNAGVGKTNLCKAIVDLYQPRTDRSTGYVSHKAGAFYIQIPSPVSTKSLASAMLEKLGDPHPNYGTAQSLTDRLIKLLNNSDDRNPQFLDELQHLLANAAPGPAGAAQRDTVRNWTKNYADKIRAPVILAGTPSCEELVNEDDQISRRFPYRFRLTNIPLIRNGEPEFQKYLVTYTDQAKRLIGVNMPTFMDRDDALRVYAATVGNPSRVHHLFKTALLRATKADLPATGTIWTQGTQPSLRLADVDLSHFRLAADEPYFAINRVTKNNPFEMNVKAICNELPAPEVAL